MSLEEVADRLYVGPPEEFTAARDAAAKAAKAEGDAAAAKQLKALKKPSVAAWLVNLLVAEQPEVVEQLLALGPALAEAQATGQGEELRALGAQRRELVTAVTQQALSLGGRDVSAAVRDEVASTLETALADPEAAQAVRSGHLVRSLSYAGFGGVDLAGAVATSGSRARPKAVAAAEPKDDRSERIAAAEAAALEAAGRLDDAVRACEQAERQRAATADAAAAAQQEVERLRAALSEAEQAAKAAERTARTAAAAADKAVQGVRRAQRKEEQARAELDALRRGT